MVERDSPQTDVYVPLKYRLHCILLGIMEIATLAAPGS